MTKKTWSIAVVMAVLGLFCTGKALAANPDTMNILVTVTGTLDVTISGDPYDFKTPSANATTMSTRAITVTNSSTDRIADWRIQLSTDSSSWYSATHAAGPGAETFVLYAMLNTAQPLAASFDANHDLGTSYQDMSATGFAGDENGDDVDATGGSDPDRSLWFLLKTPTSTGDQTQQTITVTINAVDSGAF